MDAICGAEITAVCQEENGCYGAKRITVAIIARASNIADGDAAPRVNHKGTARLIRQMGPIGYVRKRGVNTTVSKQVLKFSDFLTSRFTAKEPNATYVGDSTYLPIVDGSNMYLATVIDCYSRQLTGFVISNNMRTAG